MQNATEGMRDVGTLFGTALALFGSGGCWMKTLVLRRLPAALAGSAGVLVALWANAHISLEIPLHNLQLAWTLTRVLIQL